MKTIIMAGGRGTRISSVVSDIPKPMIKIKGKPVLEYEIECLRNQGLTDILITVSYMAEQIEEYFRDGQQFGVNIEYFIEKEPLGNAGALFKLKKKLNSDFLLLNADSVFDVDFNRLIEFHKKNGGLATVFTHPNSHPYDSGLIIADQNNVIKRWMTKEDERPEYYKNRVNAGIHVISPQIFDMLDIDVDSIGKPGINGKIIKVDLDRQVLKPMVETRKVYCYDSPEYVRDMGTPERYRTVCEDIVSGKVKAKSLRNKQKAIFLDRDGTINKYVGFLQDINQFELLPKTAEAIKMINRSGYLAIIATNQPVIARGEATIEQLDIIHKKMETLLGNEGGYIDAIYYCPHHPDRGFRGEIKNLKIDCSCRKPKPGMLIKASKDFNVDLNQSWMIGDRKSDIEAGRNAGCKTVLIGNEDYGQDITSSTLLEGIYKILEKNVENR